MFYFLEYKIDRRDEFIVLCRLIVVDIGRVKGFSVGFSGLGFIVVFFVVEI